MEANFEFSQRGEETIGNFKCLCNMQCLFMTTEKLTTKEIDPSKNIGERIWAWTYEDSKFIVFFFLALTYIYHININMLTLMHFANEIESINMNISMLVLEVKMLTLQWTHFLATGLCIASDEHDFIHCMNERPFDGHAIFNLKGWWQFWD